MLRFQRMGWVRKTFLILIAAFACRSSLAMTSEEKAEENSTEVGLSSVISGRIETVKKECKKFEEFLKLVSWKDSVPQLIVDDQRKILFCAIAKVASSNWKRVFIKALNITRNGTSDIRDVHTPGILPNLRHYSKEEQEYRLNNYFKFMFVRDPLERLLSAYRNKLENRDVALYSMEKQRPNTEGQVHHMSHRVLKVMKGKLSNSTVMPRKITFRQFVQTLTDPLYSIKHYNVHWKPYHKLCHPCFVKYDFIGKLETFQDDLAYVTKKTGLTYGPWFETFHRRTTQEISQEYYRTLSNRHMRVLREMYNTDTTMFQYNV